MNKVFDIKFTFVAVVIGTVLIIASASLVTIHHFSQINAEKQAQEIVAEMKALIPEVSVGIPDGRTDIGMPVMQISGEDFIGYIEIPTHNKALPIHNKWNKYKAANFPCKFAGSMYDGTLVIGTVENAGQLDIAKTIAGGEPINIVDVTGLKYTYAVTDIYKTKDVSAEALSEINAELIIFVRSSFVKDYVVISCETGYK